MKTKCGVRGFLWGLVAWELLVLVPIAIVFAKANRRLRTEDLGMLATVVLIGIIVVSVCYAIARTVHRRLGVPLGIGVGILFVLAGGKLLSLWKGGFEESAAIFIGCLLLSIPSAIGSGVATWIIQSRISSDG